MTVTASYLAELMDDACYALRQRIGHEAAFVVRVVTPEQFGADTEPLALVGTITAGERVYEVRLDRAGRERVLRRVQ